MLGEKIPRPQGCSEQPSPAELQGDPSPCPRPTATSPARGGARPGPRDSPGLGLGPSSGQGPTGQGSVTGGCSPTEAPSWPWEVLPTLQRHEGVSGLGDSHVPAAPALRHGGDQGDAQLLSRPRASLRRAPLPAHTSLPALLAINPLPRSVKIKRQPSFKRKKRAAAAAEGPCAGSQPLPGTVRLFGKREPSEGSPHCCSQALWHCFSPRPASLLTRFNS